MKLMLIAICVATYLLLRRLTGLTFQRLGLSKKVSASRIKYLTRTARIGLTLVFLMLLCLILGLGYGEVTLFLSSVFAVIGVALFAQWSILSNITASMVIFFGFPYRLGDRIKVTDADFDLSGVVEEISLFHVLIRTSSGDLITYPNNLILQKPVFKLGEGNTEFPQKVKPAETAKAVRSWRRPATLREQRTRSTS